MNAELCCSKMILNEELSATLDEPTGSVEMHRVEPSRLQLLALSLSDKLHQLAESNEQVRQQKGNIKESRGRERKRYIECRISRLTLFFVLTVLGVLL